MSIEAQIGKLLDRDPSITDENANKDSRVIGTMRDLLAGVVSKEYTVENTLPPEVVDAHTSGEIHIHDLDYSIGGYFNCSVPDIPYMLRNGFRMGGAEIEPPKSLRTAAEVIPQIVVNIASNQYGGTTIHEIDKILEPYAELSYKKHLKTSEQFVTPEQREDYAKTMLSKEIYDACQSLEFECNSVFSLGGQTPFLTVSFGLSETWYGRMIQESLLRVRLRGFGPDGTTPVFPKLIYILKAGHNLRPEDPQYDIKHLALECSSKRIYPDLLAYDKVVELYGTMVSPMGCARGYETVLWDNGTPHYTGLSSMWDTLSETNEVKLQPNGVDEYMNLTGVSVSDSHTGSMEMVDCVRIIKNYRNKWLKVKLRGGRVLHVTIDHPFFTTSRGRVAAEDLQVGDTIPRAIFPDNKYAPSVYGGKAWLAGNMLGDGCLHYPHGVTVSYAYTGEDEIRDRIGELAVGDRLNDREHHRGYKGTYREVDAINREWRTRLVDDFEGTKKIDRKVPGHMLYASRAERVEFLAGLIDADGYIHASGEIHIGSTNKELAYGQMALIESLGWNAKVRLNYYKGKNFPNQTRYVVTGHITTELLDALACAKKKRYDAIRPTHVDLPEFIVEEVVPVELDEPSYDVTTSSDFFDLSGIVSHNCRSFIPYHESANGTPMVYGRRNGGVVSLNLPRQAMKSQNKGEFFSHVTEQALNVRKALEWRIETLRGVQAKNNPIFYMTGACGHVLEPEDYVIDIFKNGEATFSFGYTGLAETVAAFYGEGWYGDKEAIEFSMEIMRFLNELKDDWNSESEFLFTLYGTPAESLTDRFSRLDKEMFGSTEYLFDKGWYTNSFHMDPRYKVDPFTKYDFESAYPELCTGGNIVYVEMPNLEDNLAALETLWDYASERVPYFGVNTPISKCHGCGYSGDMDADSKGYYCVSCGNRDETSLEVILRLCGYLSSASQRKPIEGRVKEIQSRVKHGDV